MDFLKGFFIGDQKTQKNSESWEHSDHHATTITITRIIIMVMIPIITRVQSPYRMHLLPTWECSHRDFFALNVPHLLSREQNSATNAERRWKQTQVARVAVHSC